jgi:hypothetical protein
MNHIITIMNVLTQELPVGTNLGMAHFLWMLVSGALLPNRGAIISGLKSIGLSDEATRRAWAAFRKGVWEMKILVKLWRGYVQGSANWRTHRYEGYLPVVVDITAFWRPGLKNCPSKHYHPAARRALPAIIFGIIGEVGEIEGQRIALPREFLRVHPKNPSETRLWEEILKTVKRGLAADEIMVVDAGLKISDLQEGGIERYEVRLANNFTARRNELPEHEGRGRKPKYGDIVRPLPRKYKGKSLAATVPDETHSWNEHGREIRAEIWRDLVLNKAVPSQENKTFDVYALYDPALEQPWLLATPIKLSAESVRSIYKDRWPVEQIPLAAKQMLGAHRQFVHNPESIQRLPELALLAGSIVSFVAATLPAIPTGFWDRKPKRTPGRFRRTLLGKPFPQSAEISGRIRKKNSFTAHLPKGILARRSNCLPSTPSVAV